jgi:hypothetical protein
MSLEELLLAALNAIELNVSVDCMPAVWGGYGDEGTPLAVRCEDVANDLFVL